MTNKRKSSISSIILNLIALVPNFVSFTRNLIRLIESEARLAGRSLLLIAMLSLVMAALLASTWFCSLALLALYLVSIHWSWMEAIFLVIILNLVLIIIVGVKIMRAKENLFFPASSEKLKNLE